MLKPADARQAQEALAAASVRAEALEIRGGGSKRGLGRPARGTVLDLALLSGILEYDPCELVLTAQAATPLAMVEAALAANRQMLGFEPPDWRALLGGTGQATLGGVLACNLSGPRRVRAGAARDHFLGFSAIDGMGEPWRAGGRVVKNVTGYDMSKLQAGAFGTLSVLTEVSLRVLPRPEIETTLVQPQPSPEAAFAMMADALNSPHEIAAASWLPAAAANRAGIGTAAVLLRLEGPAPSVAHRAREMGGDAIGAPQSAALWRAVGDVAPLLPPAGRCVWRLCPTPSASPLLLRTLQERFPGSEAFLDWGGGLLWLSLDDETAGPDGGAEAVRAALRPCGGHATLIAAPDALRAVVEVFEPLSPPMAALQDRIKRGLDPHSILNPGRMRRAA